MIGRFIYVGCKQQFNRFDHISIGLSRTVTLSVEFQFATRLIIDWADVFNVYKQPVCILSSCHSCHCLARPRQQTNVNVMRFLR